MYTAELLFRRYPRGVSDDAGDAIWSVLAALKRNGQIIDRDCAVSIVRGGYKAAVGLPERDSLRTSCLSKRVRAELRSLKKFGLQRPVLRVIGADLESDRVCECRTPSTFVLETGYRTREVPLCCGGCDGVVPLYRIPHTSKHGDYDDIRYWAWRYRCLDQLWTHSGFGEHFAYRELSRHDSDLSKTGRGVCRRIEQRSGITTYYYLYRWSGRSIAAERKRLCPSCGRKWLLDSAWHGRCDFRCDRCRLVSNIAFDVR